jgi:hypothetical protein
MIQKTPDYTHHVRLVGIAVQEVGRLSTLIRITLTSKSAQDSTFEPTHPFNLEDPKSWAEGVGKFRVLPFEQTRVIEDTMG